MSLVVVGAGFFGQRLAGALAGATLVRVDIADAAGVDAMFRAHRPSVVVNCAGKTGRPNVDWCETHQVETYRSNVVGPCVLARACAERGAYLVHLGSGCVFYGPSPHPGGWREDDCANPVSYYSKTKYAADLCLSDLPHVGIARLRLAIDGSLDERNLIRKLARYPQVIDVENSVSVVEDVITVVRAMVERRARGVFHATNPGTLRHRELLHAYRELVDAAHTAEFIAEEELVMRGLATKQRSSCSLASTRIGELGVTMRPVEQAVRAALVQYASNARAAPATTRGA